MMAAIIAMSKPRKLVMGAYVSSMFMEFMRQLISRQELYIFHSTAVIPIQI